MPRKITMRFGDTEVAAVLNDTETAQAFYDALPLTVQVSNTSGLDYCGIMPVELPWNEEQVHFGWEDGAVNYNPHGGRLAILFGGGSMSGSYGDQVDMGRVEGDLTVFENLGRSYDLVIEQA